jgi:hypothetical protein
VSPLAFHGRARTRCCGRPEDAADLLVEEVVAAVDAVAVDGSLRPAGVPGRPAPAVPRAARVGVAPEPGGMTMAGIIKRCGCGDRDECPHPWIVTCGYTCR